MSKSSVQSGPPVFEEWAKALNLTEKQLRKMRVTKAAVVGASTIFALAGAVFLAQSEQEVPLFLVERAVPSERLEGDANGDGRVDFSDISSTLANWLAGYEIGEQAPAPPQMLHTWAQANVHRLHRLLPESLSEEDWTLLVVRGDVDSIAYGLGAQARRGGPRSLEWPAKPHWPPIGSAVAEVMERWTGETGSGSWEDIEEVCRLILDSLPAGPPERPGDEPEDEAAPTPSTKRKA